MKPLTINATARSRLATTGPGILRAASVAFSAGSTLRIELNGATAGTGYDRLLVDNTATIGGATLALQTGFTPAAGAQFMILTNASGTFAGLPARRDADRRRAACASASPTRAATATTSR